MTKLPSPDLARLTLGVLAIALLLSAAAYVLSPFLPALAWATTIVIATWPILLWLQARLGRRRWAAVAALTAVLLAVLVVPLYLAISALVDSADRVQELAGSLSTFTLPPPPAWVASLPLVGPRLADAWHQESGSDHAKLVADLAPYARAAGSALASKAGSFGGTVVQFLVTVLVTAMLYASGEGAALSVRRFFRRLAGERGEDAVVLAGSAIRAVALGVVVTAVVQTSMTGIALTIAGIPRPGLLTALTLILCVAQIGPALVLIPAVIWLFSSGSTGMGIFLLVCSLATLSIDNVLRPWLIKKGADLPLWLIFSGVIGGLLAFGVIGLFIGPVVLAVAYTLVGAWVDDLGPEPGPPV